MTNRLIPLTAATAGGGLLAAAFLQAAVALADTGDDTGFTVGGLSFTDPVAIDNATGTSTAGYEALTPTFSNAPHKR